jgi:hypothetical protein
MHAVRVAQARLYVATGMPTCTLTVAVHCAAASSAGL